MEKHLWIVMALAFLVDLLLILSTSRLTAEKTQWPQAIVASLVGGVYAALCLRADFAFLGMLHWQLIMLATVNILAFGYDRAAWKQGAVFTLLQLLLRGITAGGFAVGLLSVGAVWLLCAQGCTHRTGQRPIVDVSISHGGRSVALKALVDTGNTLLDPITGRSVLVADCHAAMALLDISREQLAHPIEAFSSMHHPLLRLIPYSTVGKPTGMLLGLKADEICIDGKHQNVIVAFAPHPIGQQATYQALAGGIL